MSFTPAAETLTRASGNLLDFYNIGGLARQRTRETLLGLWNHYSWRELFIRGGILVSTAVFGMMAARKQPSLWRGLGGCAFGFFISHTVAVIPTISRRLTIKKNTEALHKDIERMLKALSDEYNAGSPHFQSSRQLVLAIQSFTDSALALQLPITKKGDAVRNLLYIKRLVGKIEQAVRLLQDKLNDGTEEAGSIFSNALEFWQQDFQAVQAKLIINEQQSDIAVRPGQ
ncbi:MULTISPECIES: hypothetical protein [unclassified Legionella]|uniref:hypothetical protein n=1 Tax=unclassified Legionella TaxID=2622702 RepID=UPI0010555A4A|nr:MULTISPECIES: hypothetical protein [unclassified Legionella]MDI9819221.1 hypothetical protein [Legionella sp. PL877]